MRLLELMLVRRWWLAPLGAAVGILIGVLASLLGSAERRAEVALLVSSPGGPATVNPQLANLRELATSGVLAGNVRATLRLEDSAAEVREQLDASVRPRSQVIVIRATDSDPEKARQLAQEAGGVFMQLVDARFADRTPPLQAAMLDSAHVLSASDRHVGRNLLIGGALGLLLGAVAASLLRGEARTGEQGGDPWAVAAATRDVRRRESVLDKRVETLSKRERELARRAGQLAAREADVARRERDAAERSAVQEIPRPAPASPAPVRDPAPGPAPVVTADGGGWNVNSIERAVAARSDVDAAQLDEWRTYLFFLREHASADGSLPDQFGGLVLEVFGDLVRR